MVQSREIGHPKVGSDEVPTVHSQPRSVVASPVQMGEDSPPDMIGAKGPRSLYQPLSAEILLCPVCYPTAPTTPPHRSE